MRVGPKFDAFLDHRAAAEFLEGVTAAGKTTVGVYKFMLETAESDKTQHIIAGLDTGVIEKNIINKDYYWNSNATRAGYVEIFAKALPDEALKSKNTVVDGVTALFANFIKILFDNFYKSL